MPIIDTGGSTAQTPLSAGRVLTRQGVIELANKRTKKVGEHLDLNLEFLVALQEFCAEHRWYWRRKSVKFHTADGAPDYDLAGIGAGDCERIIKVKLVKGPGDLTDIDPIFDDEEKEVALDDNKVGPPERYFLQSSGLRITPIPNGVYDIRIPYWAVPVSLPEKQVNAIPLVPGNLHWIVALALERNIYRIVLGDQAKAYLAAQAAYDHAVSRASTLKDFTDGNVREWKDTEDSIRSTI